MQRADITYLRIIDYKTGTKQFKLSDILYGINLQMLLYLHSIEASGGDKYGEIVPAGILYMPATVPYISSDSLKSIDKLPDELNKKLKMNGLLLKDTEIIHGMDKTDAATYIPVKIKAGEPVSSTSLATLAEFGKIFKRLICSSLKWARISITATLRRNRSKAVTIHANTALTTAYVPTDRVTR